MVMVTMEVIVIMMVMIKVIVMIMVMMKTMMAVLTSLQCLGSAFLPNTGVEARTEKRSLSWTCRQPDRRSDKS